MHLQVTDMSVLNSLTQLTWLSLAGGLGDDEVASLRLGADMMVTAWSGKGPVPAGVSMPCRSVVSEMKSAR